MAGAGLEKVAPNLLLFLVLQEYPSDVPALFPTLGTKISSFDRSLDPNLQLSAGSISPSSVTAIPLYSVELDTPGRQTRAATDGGTDDTLISTKGFTHDKKDQ